MQDSGLAGLCTIAAYYRIAADPNFIRRELALDVENVSSMDIVRAAKLIGLKARVISKVGSSRLLKSPTPALLRCSDGEFLIFNGQNSEAQLRVISPISRQIRLLAPESIEGLQLELILLQRSLNGPGFNPKTFGFRWFLPSLWRYRSPLKHVLLASLFVQMFALVTPLFFQVVIDKVLVHRSQATLIVMVIGLSVLGFFDVSLQYLRSYALSHTTNRIDVELGRRLFAHLMRLPQHYFDIRPAGQTVARMRELETIRTFLTGQGLFAGIDFAFVLVFIAVLVGYSPFLSLVVVLSIPIYLSISFLIRPLLREKIEDKFNRGAESQQFLVETIVGMQTVKASAIEPIMRAQWEEKLARYVRTAFDSTMLATLGQNGIQLISKLSTAALMFLGAQLVIDGELTVGQLIAFNMIANQVSQPILRLSQLWQDFQQVQISVDRLGDILNAIPEPFVAGAISLPAPKGDIAFEEVSFGYDAARPHVLRKITLKINAGEVLGIVGASGSGKSTLTKLIQRLYTPHEGRVLIDGVDISSIDVSWLRSHIGVVLQENLLFNRSVHDNIALANPTMSRAAVMKVSQLAGADDFISRLPQGYDTPIEERGSNISGGQRQRIAIARALARNPPILILDEATSALDYESERIIQRNMKKIAVGRTVVIVAHRLSSVRSCDRIVSMNDGCIVEIGAHDQLLRIPNGIYRRLWTMQSESADA